MDNKILEQILADTYTTSTLKKRTKALKAYLTEKYFGLGNSENINVDREELIWLKSLTSNFLALFRKEDFNDIFHSIETFLDNIMPLTIYLSFDPGEEEIKSISKFIRSNFNQNIILDIKLDYSLIGGCALIWKGVYKDYSLKSNIQVNKEQIFSSFRKYLAK